VGRKEGELLVESAARNDAREDSRKIEGTRRGKEIRKIKSKGKRKIVMQGEPRQKKVPEKLTREPKRRRGNQQRRTVEMTPRRKEGKGKWSMRK